MHEFWHDEFQQIGTDYDSVEEVALYDTRMRQFRDIEGENRWVGELARLRPESRVLEIGTGTGAFARYAAARCQSVRAIDISSVMLEYAAGKACEENLTNVVFELAGFLSFTAEPGEFDAVVTGLALHHLSDVWKSVALKRIHAALRPGGVLVLVDVVFDWGDLSPEAYFAAILSLAPGSQSQFARHIADELSTTQWIMTGLLERAGFTIAADHCDNGFLHFYQCVKS